jgi:hypothetical protein
VPTPWAYLGGTLLIGISTYHSFVELNKRLDIKEAIININRKRKSAINRK